MTTQQTAEPPIVKKSGNSKSLIIILGTIFSIVGILVLGIVLAGAIWGIKSISSGVVDDERKASSRFQSNYTAWKNAVSSYAKNPDGFLEKEKDLEGKKAGMAAKWFSLPSDSAVKTLLKKRLPDGIKIKDLKAISYEKSDDELSIHYRLDLQSREPLYMVNVGAFSPEKKDVRLQKLAKYLVLANDLPSGFTYVEGSQKEIVPRGKTVKLTWSIRKAVKEDGEWHILDTDPIPFLKDGRFEEKLLQENASPSLVRTEDDISSANSRKEAAFKELVSRAELIQQQVAKFREEASSDVPGRPIDRKGGAGSGTPTKAGMGMLAGAGAGAGLGAAAGGGDGAAIGAGAGAAAGLLGGYLWGRSDEEDELAAKRSARARAKRAAEKRISAYEDQLWLEFEQELAAKAKEHNGSFAE